MEDIENANVSEILTSIMLDQQLKIALLSLQQGKNTFYLIFILIIKKINNKK